MHAFCEFCWISFLTPLLRFFSAAKASQRKQAQRSLSDAHTHSPFRINSNSNNYTTDSDSMFMDDLTFTSPSSMVGSPGESSGLGHSPASDNHPTSSHASASAIPIKKERGGSLIMGSHGAPASAPQNHFDLREHEGEFGYVQRRIRKTSVDERRVGIFSLFPPSTSSFLRPAEGLHRFLTDICGVIASQAKGRMLTACSSYCQHHDPQRPRSRDGRVHPRS